MDLKDINSSLPKPWLNPKANSLTSNYITLPNNTSVSNPASGSISLYADGSGNLSSRASNGSVTAYGAQGAVGAQGFQGFQGVTGAQGFQGTQGVQGSFPTTVPSLTFSPATNNITGAPGGTVIAAGDIGELIASNIGSGSAVNLTSTTSIDVTSVNLTSGIWRVWGNIVITPSGGSATTFAGGLSTTLNTLPTLPALGAMVEFPVSLSSTASYNVGEAIFSISSSFTVHLVVNSTFAGTATAYGYLGAQRTS